MLFSSEFGVSISHHILLHAAIINGSRTLKEGHFAFLFATFNDFDELTRRALWQETLDRPEEKKGGAFSIAIWDSEKLSHGEGYLLFDELWETGSPVISEYPISENDLARNSSGALTLPLKS